MNGESIRDKILSFCQARRPTILFWAVFLLGLNFLVWSRIFFAAAGNSDLEIYALAVGQGDSQLVKLPGGPKLLIDGGPPNGRLLAALAEVLPANDRYVDLVMISHPQLDHFGGLVELFKRYQVGLILTNGQTSNQAAYQELEKIARDKEINFLDLARGDSISHQQSRLDILWPAVNGTAAKNPNDDALVAALTSNDSISLFTGDIPAAVEKRVADFFRQPVDILKVAHHGSKNSSAADFLAVIRPKLALIGVGKNSYGHPAPAALERLASAGAAIYRTDSDGTVKLVIGGDKLKVFKGL